MEKLKSLWLSFAERHPKAAEWVREGGLFILVSNGITLFKYLILTFLPYAFAFMGDSYVGFPGIDLTLFGYTFKWYIIGGKADYFTAYMIAMVIGEVINFFIQRKWVFRSNGNILFQGGWYALAFCIVTCITLSVDSIWKGVIVNFIPEWFANVGTIMMNGGISMVIIFFVNKIVFNDNRNKKPEKELTQSLNDN